MLRLKFRAQATSIQEDPASLSAHPVFCLPSYWVYRIRPFMLGSNPNDQKVFSRRTTLFTRANRKSPARHSPERVGHRQKQAVQNPTTSLAHHTRVPCRAYQDRPKRVAAGGILRNYALCMASLTLLPYVLLSDFLLLLRREKLSDSLPLVASRSAYSAAGRAAIVKARRGDGGRR
jgi:hypothetical protein